MYVKHFFELNNDAQSRIRGMTPQFGYNGFGEYVFYKHYSRLMYDDAGAPYANEDWADCVIRVINGVMSIRKNHYLNNMIDWNELHYQNYAEEMATSMFRMEWLPPGRGLWAMGGPAVYERGAMPLYNCAYTNIGEAWIEDICWLMDALMNGAGVGFGPMRNQLQLDNPSTTHRFQIPDSREGWVESVRQLLNAFWSDHGSMPEFDYSLIRPAGALIKTFGGIASGPGSLADLHRQLEDLCYKYVRYPEDYDEVQFKTDLANLVGVCVISGNVRRGAEIACGDVDDDVFWQLKNYDINPDREAWGWMSNNSVKLTKRGDFESIDLIARTSADGHDLGYLNMRNFPHGRIGKFDPSLRHDEAVGINPCGEIPLEHREVCNLAETLPTRCVDEARWLDACEYACFYCSTVTLLPTHQPSTNAVINKNRRIGVSIIDFSGWKLAEGVAKVTRHLRNGYQRIREANRSLAAEAGVPESIRVTTVKPGGTVPKLAGRTSGAGHPTFRYTLRRVRVGVNEPICGVLLKYGVQYEPCVHDPNGTFIFRFPIEQGPACPATDVSLWEQAMNIVLLQREWSDNAVSNTLYFKPMWILERQSNLSLDGEHFTNVMGEVFDETRVVACDLRKLYRDSGGQARFTNHVLGVIEAERKRVWFDHETDDYRIYSYNPDHEENDLEAVLAAIAPLTKSISLLPHTLKGIFPQMPEEGLTKAEYDELLEDTPTIDWSQYFGGDGVDERYCTGDTCELPS